MYYCKHLKLYLECQLRAWRILDDDKFIILILATTDEVVYIQVKPYNSYLVDKIWVGNIDGSRHENPAYLRKYLVKQS